jgi:UPF0716 protein FxsA
MILLIMLLRMNLWATLALIVVSGIVGAVLTRQQGLTVTREIRRKLSNSEMPTDALINGAMILVAGGLLLTPGLLTDLIGMSIMIPFCRRWYRKRLTEMLKRRFKVTTFTSGFSNPNEWHKNDDDNTIDSYVISSSEDKKSE